MTQGDTTAQGDFRRLKRASYTGNILLFAWIGIAGGAILTISGSAVGLLLLLIGLALIIYRLLPAFDKLVDRNASWSGLPLLTFLVNILLVAMVGMVARVYVRDPFVLYNRQNTIGLIVWSVAAALSIGTLIANIFAYRRDLRDRG